MQKFTVHTIESAPEKSKQTLRGMQQKFGFLPNILGSMAENLVLLNGFAATFGSFHGGRFDKCARQVFLLTKTVSLKGPCPAASTSHFPISDPVPHVYSH